MPVYGWVYLSICVEMFYYDKIFRPVTGVRCLNTYGGPEADLVKSNLETCALSAASARILSWFDYRKFIKCENSCLSKQGII